MHTNLNINRKLKSPVHGEYVKVIKSTIETLNSGTITVPGSTEYGEEQIKPGD